MLNGEIRLLVRYSISAFHSVYEKYNCKFNTILNVGRLARRFQCWTIGPIGLIFFKLPRLHTILNLLNNMDGFLIMTYIYLQIQYSALYQHQQYAKGF